MVAVKYLIWWTSQHDCERIQPLAVGWPTYLREEYASRVGRPGRGRLWVHESFEGEGGPPEQAKWDDDNWWCEVAADAGGIVIRLTDLKCVQCLPGFVTTFDMQLPEGEDR